MLPAAPAVDILCPPLDPLTPPPLAPTSPPLSNPTECPAIANTVLDTAEDVAAATGDVLCGNFGKIPADDWPTAVVCPCVCNWLAGIATDVSDKVADVLVPVGQVEPVGAVDWDIGVTCVLDIGSVVVV